MAASVFRWSPVRWHVSGNPAGMITALLSFLFLAGLMSLLVHADQQSASAADAVRLREGDL